MADPNNPDQQDDNAAQHPVPEPDANTRQPTFEDVYTLLHGAITQIANQQAVIQHLVERKESNARIRGQLPPKFDGKDRQSLDTWMFQVDNYLALAQIPQDDAKIALVVSLLDGGPLSWAQALTETPVAPDLLHPMTHYPTFKAAFQAAWGVQHGADQAIQRLLALRQTGKATDYAAEFRLLLARGKSRPEDTFLVTMFRNGLKDSLQRAIAGKEPHEPTFDTYANWVITVEERLANTRSAPSPSRTESGIPRQTQSSRPTVAPVENRDPAAMDVDRVQRRQGTHCYVCGHPDHLANACAKRHRVAATVENPLAGIPHERLVDALVDALKVVRGEGRAPTPEPESDSEVPAEKPASPTTKQKDFA